MKKNAVEAVEKVLLSLMVEVAMMLMTSLTMKKRNRFDETASSGIFIHKL